jgi:hypothetical protein
MIVLQFRRYIVRTLVIGAALLALGFHFRYAREPATMDDLLRISYVAPYAADHKLSLAMQQAVTHQLNYLQQTILYFYTKDDNAHSVTWYRSLNALGAFLAVIWMYRLGSLCCSSLTGLGAACVLTLTPPPLWNHFAFQIFFVLLHCECFLIGIRRDTFLGWSVWIGVTLLLFMNGIFAEPLLLQTWCIALVLVWFIWRYGALLLPEHNAFIHGAYHRGERRGGGVWEKMRQDSGFSRFATTVLGIAIVIFVFCFVVGAFFSRLVTSFNSIVKVLFLGIGLTVLAAVALLMTPLFVRERNMALDRLVSLRIGREISSPQLLFQRVADSSLLHALFAYACAVLLFLPFFYSYRSQINLYVDSWEFSRFFAFMNADAGWLGWASVGLPLAACVLTLVGYFASLFSRARVIGSFVMLVLGSVYLVQQRYAIYAVPFQLILSVAAVTTILDMGIAMLPLAWEPATDELQELT